MADEEAVPLENDFHVSSDINLDVEGDIRVQGISSDDEDSTTLDEPISVTLVCLFLFFLTAKLHYFFMIIFVSLFSRKQKVRCRDELAKLKIYHTTKNIFCTIL